VNPTDVLKMLVSDLLAERPAAARVFCERRMGCVGCAFARFETVEEVAQAYGINCWDLANSLVATGDHT
jgi:hybrid cluster-associated redox disulfide protein